MKSLFRKLSPGFFAALIALGVGALCIGYAQQPAPMPAAAQPSPQIQVIQQPVPQQYTVCGVCGARILAPQMVLVAPAYYPTAPRPDFYGQPLPVVRGQNGYYFADDCGDAGCRIPPAPVFSLTDYQRADPRLIRRERDDRRFR